MAIISKWQPGKLYQPGSVVIPNEGAAVTQTVPVNAGFASGDTGWTKGTGWTIDQVGAFQGTWSAVFAGNAAEQVIVNDTKAVVVPGQTIRTRVQIKTFDAASSGYVGLRWYNDALAVISTVFDDTPVAGVSVGWRESYLNATAPPAATSVSVVIGAIGLGTLRADNIVLEHFLQAGASEFTYAATQAAAGFSGTVEPAWPIVLGNTVIDNAVTWTARAANSITYEAKAILKSAASEPTWPTTVNTTVHDNTILWTAEAQNIKDVLCPNTKYVAIAASKIFCGDDDIVAFSATVNPLDWSTTDDAGFIPFGMNSYGSEPIRGLSLYRSNLVVFNSKGFQMWQVDEDPNNFAILDAIPVGSTYYKSGSSVQNDLVFLTANGIRSMGIAGASTNIEAGVFGKQVDPLVKTAIAGMGDEDNIISLFHPGTGQYWLIFGAEAFVLTLNGGKADMSWSRYVFPSAITDWAIDAGVLVLRSGNKIWEFDEDTLGIDDVGGAGVAFTGRVWWPYLDLGSLGQDKTLIGFDTVANGAYNIAFGYDQGNLAAVTADFAIADGDTIVGDIVPFELVAPSIQMRLTFTGSQDWEWSASTLYLEDGRKA